MARNIQEKDQATDHRRSLKGILADYVRRPLSEKDWPKVRAETWEQASIEDWTKEDEKVKAERS